MLNRQIGSYTIVAPLGTGGMGEVYRARDSKLGRDVAIKILSSNLTADPERRARFAREARLLATLNHPHIGAIYGLEESDGLTALVLELVEGPTLADRLEHGPLPIAEALEIARQIAEALDEAHEKGIVHRDLKPANIVLQGVAGPVAGDVRVKVLDFGLAKTLTAGPGLDVTQSLGSLDGTVEGRILGTPAYMSPEQARGLAVDKRTDIWAFGCVLFEMLTGRRPFEGDTVTDIFARILEHDPDWTGLPAETPAPIRSLIKRCLRKDPRKRLHDIADAAIEMDSAIGEAPYESTLETGTRATVASSAVRRLAIGLGVVALMVVVGTWTMWRGRPGTIPPARVMSLTSYPGNELSPSFSPDGKQVAFSWDGEKADNENIYVLIVGSDIPVPITRHAARDISPAWKPDGTQIAFVRVEAGRAAMYLVSPLGESEQKLAEFSALPAFLSIDNSTENDPILSWSPDGRWLAISRVTAGDERGLFLLAADGAKRLLLLPTKTDDECYAAAFSPTGDALAFVCSGYIEVVGLGAADPPAINGTPRRLTPQLGPVKGLVWTRDGKELLFGEGHIFANDYHLWRVPVSGDRALERIDLAGVGAFPAVSASGDRLAYSRRSFNVDLLELEEGHEPRTILASTFNEYDASFSPDGSKIAFGSDRTGEGTDVWVASIADGSERRSVSKGLYRSTGSPRWSRDGSRLAFDGLGDDGQRHVYLVDEAGGPIRPLPSKPGFYDQVPSWSRDGKWIYFGSNRTGRDEVWRVPVAGGGDAQQMTRTGGQMPVESWDGQTLYFSRLTDGGRVLLAMPVAGGPERTLGVTTTFWNYVPGKHGLFYVPLRQGQKAPYTYEVRLLDVATGKSRTWQTVSLAAMLPGLSVSPDGKTVLVSGAATINNDLMRIENFR